MGLGKWTVGNCLLTGTGEECVCAAGLGRFPPEFLHLPFSYPKHKPSFNSATTKLLPSTCLLHLQLTASCCDAVVAILLVLVSCSWSQLPLRTPGPFLVPSPLLLVQYFQMAQSFPLNTWSKNKHGRANIWDCSRRSESIIHIFNKHEHRVFSRELVERGAFSRS